SEDFSASTNNPPYTSKGTTSHDVQIYDLVVTYDVSDDLGLWANADYGRLDRSRNTTVVGSPFGASTRTDPRWWGVAGGFSYDINEKVNLAMRGEYFFDDGGSRLYTAFGTTPRSETRLATGTATLSYALTNNLTARLEYRHDHISGQAGDPFPNQRDGCAGSTNVCEDSIDVGIVEVNYQFD
ncbi:MAG: outer membrane beta-barrel protein, partial [Deltaproteobacteria bacterium]|nr:outer membrane beta-barrel protein [Deltaproteobacteria bacterium]